MAMIAQCGLNGVELSSNQMRASLSDRFWAKVRKAGGDACWQWTGFRVKGGYGTIGLGGRRAGKEFAHRVSWTLNRGPIPGGLWVLHRCDNPPCVRPDHLFVGTARDNNTDTISKGRRGYTGRPGSLHHRAKIQESTIQKICELRRDGFSQTQIGSRIGLTQGQIGGILRGSYWRHVQRPAWFKHEIGRYQRKAV